MPIRVVLADDHAMVREGLRVLLGKAADIVVVGEAESGAAASALARRLVPDVVVLDLDMPGGHGTSVLRDLISLAGVRVLVLTMHVEDGRLVPLLEAGARGFLSKEGAARDLVDAIRVVAAGEVYVRPTAARMLAAAIAPKCPTDSAPDRFRELSDRERTVVRMVAEGYSGVEIARELGISTKTVDAYKRRVQDKLGLAHRTHYVRFALEAGVFDGRYDASRVVER
ncbi:MAG TPA: response regulator transcription factor [Gemmatimonadaceae bacterium]|nr:response regulator transcription factor [Gemmatimonadaceae bacterium]